MSGESSLGQALDGIAFEELDQALRAGQKLEAWSSAFVAIVERVTAAIRRRFPDEEIVQDAAQSACRTFFRRMQEQQDEGKGRYDLDGPQALVGLLVSIAFHKACQRHREAQRGPDALGAEVAADANDPGAAERGRVLREAMRHKLEGMLDQVKESLTRGLHRKILPYWFRKVYRGERLSQEEVANRLGCSVNTVARVFKDIEDRWRPLVDQGRRSIRALAEQLR